MATQNDDTTETNDTPATPIPGEANFKALPHADDDELADAIAEAETAGKAGEADAATETEGDGETVIDAGEPAPAAVTQSQPTQQAKPGNAEPMIPKSRFDEARVKAKQEGIAETLELLARMGVKVATTQDQQQPAETPAADDPATTIAKLEAESDALAEQYDRGEITYAALKAAERQISKRITALEAASVVDSRISSYTEAQVDEANASIVERFPIYEKLTPETLKLLVPDAFALAKQRGIEVPAGDRGDIVIRHLVGEIATRKFGAAFGLSLPADTTQPASTPKPPTSAASAKLAKARTLPPDLNLVSRQGGPMPGEQHTPERLMDMDVDDLAALPSVVVNRITGATR